MDSRELDLHKYGILLQEKLALIGEEQLIKELQDWSETAFTTSSELMGEMMLILKKISTAENLDKATRKTVTDTIKAIKKALKTRQ